MKITRDSYNSSSKSDTNFTLPNYPVLPRPQIPGSLISLYNTVSAAQPYISSGNEWKPLGICGVNGGVIWAPFRTGELPPTTFTSFTDAHNAILQLPKPNIFYFDPTEGPNMFPVSFPAIPVGTYDFTGVEWVGLQKGSNMVGASNLIINIPDGVHIIGLTSISSLQINYTGFTPCVTFPILNNQIQIIYLHIGCLINTTNAPFFRAFNSDNLGNSVLALILDFFSAFANGSQPVVSISDGIVLTIILSQSSGVEINTIITDPPVNGNGVFFQYLGSYNANSPPFFPFIRASWTNINAGSFVQIQDSSGAPKSYTTGFSPLPANDATQGWKNTDIWIDSNTSIPYICIDANTGLWHAF